MIAPLVPDAVDALGWPWRVVDRVLRHVPGGAGRHGLRRWPRRLRTILSDMAFEALWSALRVYLRMHFRCEVRGPVPKFEDGPVLIAPTHASHLDAVVCLAALPRAVRRRIAVAGAADHIFAKPTWIQRIVRWGVHAFPFVRHGGSQDSLNECVDRLRNGSWVLMFPQAGRTSGESSGLTPGFLSVASKAGVPYVPVRIRGSERAMKKGDVLPRRAHVTIEFAPARAVPSIVRACRNTEYRQSLYRTILARVERELAEMDRRAA